HHQPTDERPLDGAPPQVHATADGLHDEGVHEIAGHRYLGLDLEQQHEGGRHKGAAAHPRQPHREPADETGEGQQDRGGAVKGGENLINQDVQELGGLDILVNSAGILRDRMSFNMDEADCDAVINVHLKGHFVPSRFAGASWRAKAKETGEPVNASVSNTSSEAGLFGNAGQLNYGAAKAGIAAMTIILARELER